MKNDKQQPEKENTLMVIEVEQLPESLITIRANITHLKDKFISATYCGDDVTELIDSIEILRIESVLKLLYGNATAPLSNETKVVESVEQAAQNMAIGITKPTTVQEFFIAGADWQFKNTDAVKAYAENRKVELKAEWLDKDNPFPPDYYNARIDELNRLLKLIQP